MRASAGFTLIELVTIMVLIGILAVVAIPRMSTSGYSAVAFRDQTASALRYAQKTATSHRRLVCATFTATSLALTIATAKGVTVCDTPLLLPGGASSVQSSDTVNAVFSPVPSALFFQSDGRGTSDGAGTAAISTSLTIADQTITVIGASGYVQ